MDAYLKEAPFSDLTACGPVLAGIPSRAQLQMGNSSIVRYIPLFNSRSDCTYFSNRGTSGIDGSSSTALGASLVSKEPVYLFTGDLSFLYDSNAFWNEYLSSNLKIILFNNGGGGIFQIIDGPNNFPELKDSFETPQSMNFEKLSDFYNLDYYLATNTHNIEENLAKLHSSTGTSSLEMRTPSDQNEGVLKQFFRTIKSLHHGE